MRVRGLLKQNGTKTYQSLFTLKKYFSTLLEKIEIDFKNIDTINKLFLETEEFPRQILDYTSFFIELSKVKINQLPDKGIIEEYNHSLYKDFLQKMMKELKI